MIARVVPGIYEAECIKCDRVEETKASSRMIALDRFIDRFGWKNTQWGLVCPTCSNL